MKRKGITLTEALVALFIAALGMISLLTLFPLGAMQMGQALKDSRSAQAAQEADGLMRWYWAKYETDPTSTTDPIQAAMDTGDGAGAITSGVASYPVLVDPQGSANTWASGAGVLQKRRVGYDATLAPNGLTNVPRRTVSNNTAGFPGLLTTNAMIERYTVLQDELEYGEQQKGIPGSAALNGKVERGAQYSWSWLLQRPNNARRGVVNMQVVVYFKRSPTFSKGDHEAVYRITGTDPSGTNVRFYPGTTKLTIPYSGTRPELIKGRWIMDVTNSAGGSAVRHANFYRVVSVNAETPNYLFVELETPIRRNDGSSVEYTGDLVIFKHVAEVFERPPLVTGDPANP